MDPIVVINEWSEYLGLRGTKPPSLAVLTVKKNGACSQCVEPKRLNLLSNMQLFSNFTSPLRDRNLSTSIVVRT